MATESKAGQRWASALLMLVIASHARAAVTDERDDDFSVRKQSAPGQPVDEVIVEGDMDALVRDIRDALLDVERMPKFMPYVAEVRDLGSSESDRFQYVRLRLPFVKGRDYVIHLVMDPPTRSGGFAYHWVSEPTRLPAQDHLVRIQTHQGGWTVFPNGDGTSHVVYHFIVDPGGDLPPFLRNNGRQGGADVFRAVEREAQRRAELRAATAR